MFDEWVWQKLRVKPLDVKEFRVRLQRLIYLTYFFNHNNAQNSHQIFKTFTIFNTEYFADYATRVNHIVQFSGDKE